MRWLAICTTIPYSASNVTHEDNMYSEILICPKQYVFMITLITRLTDRNILNEVRFLFARMNILIASNNMKFPSGYPHCNIINYFFLGIDILKSNNDEENVT